MELPGVERTTFESRVQYTNYYYFFLTPVLNSRGMKKLRYAIQKKYKNQAGMNLTPPPYYYYYYEINTPGSIDPRG